MVCPPATSEAGARQPAKFSWSNLRKHHQNQHN
jgi:hypothetical protein